MTQASPCYYQLGNAVLMEMQRIDSSQAILSLANAYSEDDAGGDVDNISGSDDETPSVPEPTSATQNKRPAESPVEVISAPARVPRKAARLVSYGPDEADEEDEIVEKSDEEEDAKPDIQGTEFDSSLDAEMASSLSRSVMNMSADEVKLPPEPPGSCSRKLQEKILSFQEKMHSKGLDLNASIQKRKDFRNPSIYEKLIQFIGIDEKGTNFPKNIYNPSIYGPESYYDELARAQKVEMDKREKERKDRTKIEFVTGTKKTDGSTVVEQKRKTKWDAQPTKPVIVTTTITNPPVISVTTSASGSKTTVISAIGTISKKPK